jgi:hypothetical protein
MVEAYVGCGSIFGRISTEPYFMREAESQQGIELLIMKGVGCVDRQAVDREAVDSPFVLDWKWHKFSDVC